MLRKIKFNNFYSFYKDQEISFLATKKNSYDYHNSDSGNQITKIAGFLGGNASGKTNIMRLLSFFSYFTSSSIKEAGELNLGFKTFFNNNTTSKFLIEFEDNNYIYFYSFSTKSNSIIKEELTVKKMVKSAQPVKVFSRKDNSIVDLNKVYFKNFPIKTLKTFVKNIRSDVSLIAYLNATYHIDIIKNIYDYFTKFRTNINEKGEINNYYQQLLTLENYISDDKLKKEMEEFVCKFDLGLNGFVIDKKEINSHDETKVYITVQGIHETKEIDKHLDFKYESRSTQSLFFTLAKIISGINNNAVIILDEIESGFHPEALNKLIDYFINKNENNSAQLIFSSHSLGFMNKLDMHQLYFVEKNNNSESNCYRLNDVKGIRTDENFHAKYMAGAYGAFPKIKL